jgi:hypothetical protein
MLCPLFFLLKSSEGKIRTANPPLSANTKKFDSAYVAGGSAGLQTVDIRNPDSPRNIGSVETPGDARNVVVFWRQCVRGRRSSRPSGHQHS